MDNYTSSSTPPGTSLLFAATARRPHEVGHASKPALSIGCPIKLKKCIFIFYNIAKLKKLGMVYFYFYNIFTWYFLLTTFYFPAQLVKGLTRSDLLTKPWSQVVSLYPCTFHNFVAHKVQP